MVSPVTVSDRLDVHTARAPPALHNGIIVRRMTTALTGVFVLAAALVLIWAVQRRLMYFPAGDVPPPTALGLTNVEPVTFATADGVTLRGWFFPGLATAPPQARATVLVCNGNAGNRAYRAPLASALRSHGVSVLLFDYRGFGESGGAPTEHGLAADSRAARDYLLRRHDVRASRLLYFGESLGAAVAIELAEAHPPAALILRSPFTSMTDVGRLHYPMLPVRWLLRDRYPSIDRIARVRMPLLVIAGDRDAIVPLDQSRRLYEAAASRDKNLLVIPGADHNDDALLTGDAMISAIVALIERLGA
jgi:fermentation-respiration switch protein FrsA (DUF1100 family)